MVEYTQATIKELLLPESESDELLIKVPSGSLRIHLKPQSLKLWSEALKQYTEAYNLLLACENSSGSLKETNLTW